MDQPNLNMRHHRWLDAVKDYDWEIFYHPGKENVVADAFSHKSVGSSFREMCIRISMDFLLLGLIREAQVEGVRKGIGYRKGSEVRLTYFSRIVEGN